VKGSYDGFFHSFFSGGFDEVTYRKIMFIIDIIIIIKSLV
jgi:hypothetical protein